MALKAQHTSALFKLASASGARDIEAELQRQALHSTAEFVGRDMDAATAVDGHGEVLEYALKRMTLNGLICEFGVADGHTINFIAREHRKYRARQSVHGFDCFTGLPERWRDGFEEGNFACSLPAVASNVVLHQGLFADTLPDFVQKYPEPLAFLHIDSDLYSSAKIVLDLMKRQIVPGTIIVFDEFFNYPGWQNHEARAWSEFICSGPSFQYLCYNKVGEQVAVQIL